MKGKQQAVADLSVKEAAEALNVCEATVVKWVKTGRMNAHTRRVLVPKEELRIHVDSIRRAHMVTCRWCKKQFEARSPRAAKYCCPAHRVAAFRQRHLLE